jgi:hypothetical protein
MPISAAETTDETAPARQVPAAVPSPLSEEQRRWIAAIAAEIKRGEPRDGASAEPPAPARG